MAEQGAKPTRQQSQSAQTQDIAKDQWTTFLAEFTRENRGTHARVEVLGPDIGDQVQTDDRPFDGISADTKDGEDAVWITFGSTTQDHLTHGVQNVKAIRVRQAAGQSGTALQIVTEDGTTTLLELSQPEAYTLPPRSS
jgi:Family of unknown function (DUF5335)